MEYLPDRKPSDCHLEPRVIIHGGAGAISRTNLPPELYVSYQHSLLTYLKTSQALLQTGSSALDAACNAVSLMEDDPLFNCGRGSVFTKAGTIEMEASVMIASILEDEKTPGSIKRGAAVSLVRKTRHPIMLAKEVLLAADEDAGLGGADTMHCHLSGTSVESWGFEKKNLEKKPKQWFWTKKRWDEHRRGLNKDAEKPKALDEESNLPSQGTVGAVCVDAQGNLAVATSTGGLTNKSPGRIGDTPTIGSGFWAEGWNEEKSSGMGPSLRVADGLPAIQELSNGLSRVLSCLPGYMTFRVGQSQDPYALPLSNGAASDPAQSEAHRSRPARHRRAVAMSGTGNGDSFLRTNACRTAAALSRFSGMSLQRALRRVAGPDGELQQSAGDRWKRTGEGEGGVIGVEICGRSTYAVFDFNCGGLWRAWYDDGVARVMVFKEEYQS